MTTQQLGRFWYDLGMALTRREIPFALRTERACDVGWGKGMRLLIDSQDRITHPEGRFVPMAEVNVEAFARDIQRAFVLTRTERRLLNDLREGADTFRHQTRKTVRVGDRMYRESTMDKLTRLGLVDELAYESDSEYVAVQPESVGPSPRVRREGVFCD